MAVRAKITTKGFTEALEVLAEMGRDVSPIIDEALEAGGNVLLDGMQRRVPKDTHNLEEHLALEGPYRDGNYHFVQVGMAGDTDSETARYGTAQEYGTSNRPAQPYIRPTIDEDIKAARRKMLSVLKEAGQ